MADPVVVLTNGVPTSGSGAITTLGQHATILATLATAPFAKVTDGTNTAAVKAASTAAAATDPAVVVALSPNGVTRGAGAADASTVRVTMDSGQLGSMVTGDFTKATPTVPVENPTDQAVPIKVQAVANGLTSSRVNAAASTNATSLKASAGNVFQIDLFNVAAYDVFFKFYNKASAPTVGTDTPTWTIPIKAGTGFSVRFPFGKSFATGVAYATTKLQADSDTTVLVAGDVTGSIDWI